MVKTILGQLIIYMHEARKSNPKLNVTFPSLDSQKLDSPYVSLLKICLHLFMEFSHAIKIPCILCNSLEESSRSLKKDEHLILLQKKNRIYQLIVFLLDLFFKGQIFGFLKNFTCSFHTCSICLHSYFLGPCAMLKISNGLTTLQSFPWSKLF